MSDERDRVLEPAMDCDRRQGPRAAVVLRVEYTKLNAFFADYTRNISHGGTFIRSDDPLPVGTVFMFRLIVPKLSSPIALRGEVVWAKAPGQPSPPGVPAGHEPGMGIRFLYDSPEQRAAIAETVEQLMIESLGPHLYAKLMGRNGA
ncbi:MAG: TIGR02266 family protein [Myxococcales bacterium]|nr:TIGR02266 family protein [Myxococcota bacterium]MDW8284261.1 TIGR02266 family protein [Myxococcales bacterium]